MAEEDLIFGKNRHLYGGLQPSDMELFACNRITRNDDGSLRVIIKAHLPKDTTIIDPDGNEQVICSVGGAVIRRTVQDDVIPYIGPENEFDGEFVANITEDCEIIDAVVDGKRYHYAAFPYSKQGVYNKSGERANSFAVVPDGTKIPHYYFGFDIDTDDSNPQTRVSYPKYEDVYGDMAYFDKPVLYNAEYSPATDVSSRGDWNITPGEKFMPRPCMLKYDGTVAYYLNPSDYSLKEDGTASDISNSSFEGNAMLEWPKIYTKRWEENGVYHFRCSDIKIDEDWECWCNYDVNNNEIDHFYTAIYLGKWDKGKNNSAVKLRSLEGTDYYGDTSSLDGRNDHITAIKRNNVNNNDWYMLSVADNCLINDLLILIGKTTAIDIDYSFFGGNSDVNTADILLSDMRMISSGKWECTVYQGCSEQHFGAITTFTKPDGVYWSLSGYIKYMATYPWGRMPIDVTASSSTYECSRVWWTVSTDYEEDLVIPDTYIGTSEYRFGENSTGSALITCKPCITTE